MKFLIFLAMILFMARFSFSQAFIAVVDKLPLNTEAVVTKTTLYLLCLWSDFYLVKHEKR